MTTFQGLSVAPGYAAGTALVCDAEMVYDIDTTPIETSDISDEIERFEVALQTSVRELEWLRDRVLADIGQSESFIFEAHLDLLNDETFVQGVKKRIAEDLVHADHAVDLELALIKQMLMRTGNAYLRERTQDVEDLARRLQKNLKRVSGDDEGYLSVLSPQTILVAHQLFPSDTLNLDREHVAGIITEVGGAQSHAAILARSLGIPAITGVADITKHVNTGDQLLLDATAGIVTLEPTKEIKQSFSRARQAYELYVRETSEPGQRECRTRCGTKIDLYANIGRAEEALLVPDSGLSGVGLFRTEYLFLNAPHAPSLDMQAGIYRQALEALDGLPLTLRTIDFGGDKHPMFLKWTREENPNLGLRGLQFAMAHRELFEDQLRAALRSASHGTLRILFPMITDTEKLVEAIDMVKKIASEEGLEYVPQVGAMIETPAAIFQLDHILRFADFISIGTNDLTQFILAADRDSLQMMAQYSVLHPAVLRAVRQIVSTARSHERECTICGEAAGDPGAAALFVGLGVRNLSMSTVLAPKVRRKINRQYLSDLEDAATRALGASSIKEVESILDQLPA